MENNRFEKYSEEKWLEILRHCEAMYEKCRKNGLALEFDSLDVPEED